MPIKPPLKFKRIDWSQIIFDLERCGMTQRTIGLECGIDEDEAARLWCHRLKNIPGNQPKFHNGAMLLGLWAERTDAEPDDAPTEAGRTTREVVRYLCVGCDQHLNWWQRHRGKGKCAHCGRESGADSAEVRRTVAAVE